jgi:hypothetical protein
MNLSDRAGSLGAWRKRYECIHFWRIALNCAFLIASFWPLIGNCDANRHYISPFHDPPIGISLIDSTRKSDRLSWVKCLWFLSGYSHTSALYPIQIGFPVRMELKGRQWTVIFNNRGEPHRGGIGGGSITGCTMPFASNHLWPISYPSIPTNGRLPRMAASAVF